MPTDLASNALYLRGTWNVTAEYAESVSESEVVYKFDAKSVYIVAESSDNAEIEVFEDGVFKTSLNINESGIYTLIDNTSREEHTLTIKVKSGIVKFYAFTFG